MGRALTWTRHRPGALRWFRPSRRLPRSAGSNGPVGGIARRRPDVGLEAASRLRLIQVGAQASACCTTPSPMAGRSNRSSRPGLCNLLLNRPLVARRRRELLAAAKGDVLEIGFGTGLNLPHYPAQVRRLTTVDPNAGMRRLAEKRAQRTGIEVDQRACSGERLPFEDNAFDSVVSTFTLCSIEDVLLALTVGLTIAFNQNRDAWGLAWVWNAPVTFGAIVLIGAQQHRLTTLGHEASHYMLFRNRRLNELVSDWLCLFPMWTTTQGYRLQHLAHNE
jgi:SAM-dependent methyltransferase